MLRIILVMGKGWSLNYNTLWENLPEIIRKLLSIKLKFLTVVLFCMIVERKLIVIEKRFVLLPKWIIILIINIFKQIL